MDPEKLKQMLGGEIAGNTTINEALEIMANCQAPAETILKQLLNYGWDTSKVLEAVWNADSSIYDPESGTYAIDEEIASLQHQLIKLILETKVNFGKVIYDIKRDLGLLSDFKELIVKHFGADNLLYWSVYMAPSGIYYGRNANYPNHEASLACELVKFAIDNNADVNVNIDGNTPLDIANNQEVIDLLKSYDAKCSNSNINEIVENGLQDILIDPAIIIEQKYKNLNAERGQEAKMPYIVHHIWLTSPDNPREIREQDLKIVLDTKDTFSEAPVSWEHIVWTNNQSLIPASVMRLEKHGVKVKSIYEYNDTLSLFTLIEELITQEKWGMASDTLRYSLIKHFGGVYADLNFMFNRDVTNEAHTYNFFTKTYGAYYIDNFFFGASPNHPVVNKAVELVERNLVNPPKYLTEIKNQNSRVLTDMGTAHPILLAYYKEANKDDNVDVVYPLTKEKESTYDFIDESDPDAYFISDDESALIRMEITRAKCPEEGIYIDFVKYINDHEICGDEIYNVGCDLEDGETWIT